MALVIIENRSRIEIVFNINLLYDHRSLFLLSQDILFSHDSPMDDRFSQFSFCN